MAFSFKQIKIPRKSDPINLIDDGTGNGVSSFSRKKKSQKEDIVIDPDSDSGSNFSDAAPKGQKKNENNKKEHNEEGLLSIYQNEADGCSLINHAQPAKTSFRKRRRLVAPSSSSPLSQHRNGADDDSIGQQFDEIRTPECSPPPRQIGRRKKFSAELKSKERYLGDHNPSESCNGNLLAEPAERQGIVCYNRNLKPFPSSSRHHYDDEHKKPQNRLDSLGRIKNVNYASIKSVRMQKRESALQTDIKKTFNEINNKPRSSIKKQFVYDLNNSDDNEVENSSNHSSEPFHEEIENEGVKNITKMTYANNNTINNRRIPDHSVSEGDVDDDCDQVQKESGNFVESTPTRKTINYGTPKDSPVTKTTLDNDYKVDEKPQSTRDLLKIIGATICSPLKDMLRKKTSETDKANIKVIESPAKKARLLEQQYNSPRKKNDGIKLPINRKKNTSKKGTRIVPGSSFQEHKRQPSHSSFKLTSRVNGNDSIVSSTSTSNRNGEFYRKLKDIDVREENFQKGHSQNQREVDDEWEKDQIFEFKEDNSDAYNRKKSHGIHPSRFHLKSSSPMMPTFKPPPKTSCSRLNSQEKQTDIAQGNKIDSAIEILDSDVSDNDSEECVDDELPRHINSDDEQTCLNLSKSAEVDDIHKNTHTNKTNDESKKYDSKCQETKFAQELQPQRILRPRFGDRKKVSAIRIAIGSNIFTAGCELAFQPGTSEQHIFLFYENKSDENSSMSSSAISHVEEHKIDLSDINVLKYWVQRDESCIETQDENNLLDDMSFIVMRISPNEGNKLKKMNKVYLTNEEYSNLSGDKGDISNKDDLWKRGHIVVELRDNSDFESFISAMKQNFLLHALLQGAELKQNEMKNKYLSVILEEKLADIQERKSFETSRRRSQRLKTNYSLSQNSQNDEMFIYPFAPMEGILDDIAQDLTELGGKLCRSVHTEGKEKVEWYDPKKCTEISKPLDDHHNEKESKTVWKSTRTHYLTILREDFDRLAPREFLNDTLIDFWMKWISRSENSLESNLHFFTSHFFTTLMEDSIETVTSWTAKKNIDIFSKKFIFIPINEYLHWSLCVVINSSMVLNLAANSSSKLENDCREDSQSEYPVILFMDSLKAHKKVKVAKNIRRWMNSEAKRLGHIEDDGDDLFTPQSIKLFDPKIPYQSNSWDCGVFVCRYAYSLLLLRNEAFTKSKLQDRYENMITMSAEFNFDKRDIYRIRDEMIKLINRLSKIYSNHKSIKKQEVKTKKAKSEKSYANVCRDFTLQHFEENKGSIDV